MHSGFDSSQPVSPVTETDEAVSTETPQPKGSRMIATMLVPAVKLWLRSQVEQIEDLQIKIEAGDRQLLSGYIHQVTVAAHQAVYQGLHLSQVSLVAEKIRINLRQMLRGQPFRLLEPIPVEGELLLSEADLNLSLQAPLLANAVTEFLVMFLQAGDAIDQPATQQPLDLQNLQIALAPGQAVLSATLMSASGNPTPIAVRTGFHLASSNQLRLENPQWLPSPNARRGLPIAELDGYTFDLGSDVAIRALTLEVGQVVCRGKIQVTPELN